jgi:hypothetical protein
MLPWPTPAHVRVGKPLPLAVSPETARVAPSVEDQLAFLGRHRYGRRVDMKLTQLPSFQRLPQPACIPQLEHHRAQNRVPAC